MRHLTAVLLVALPDTVLAALVGAGSAVLVSVLSQIVAGRHLTRTLRDQAAEARQDREFRAREGAAEREFRARQEQTADRRALRDARYLRLRKAYATVIATSLAMRQVVHESGFVVKGETAESRDARLGRMLAEAFTSLAAARVELMMENEGREVLEVFDNVVQDAYLGYRIGLAANAENAGTVHPEVLNAHRDDLAGGVDALIASARTRLGFLEDALPGA
jgi:hypothetical protein